MVLTDTDILKAIEAGNILIEPFDRKLLGSNSYDVTLGKDLATYKFTTNQFELDAKKDNPIHRFEIPEEGFVLQPGILYLGVTEQYTKSMVHVPDIDGKSSTGRLGISIHITAGVGDVGFIGHWTLEITVVHPVRVYAGMPIGQLRFIQTLGNVSVPYYMKENAKYNKQPALPMPSQMWKNFPPETELRTSLKEWA